MDAVPACLAYLDAFTGSMLLQIVLGGAGGLIVVSRLFWHRIRRVLPLQRADSTAEQAVPATDQAETAEQTPEGQARRAA